VLGRFLVNALLPAVKPGTTRTFSSKLMYYPFLTATLRLPVYIFLMPDVSSRTIQQLWYETKDYSWEALRQGLDHILERQVIARQTYERMRWAINKLESLRIDFPTSASELEDRINFYL
jgi:hypothetical protein